MTVKRILLVLVLACLLAPLARAAGWNQPLLRALLDVGTDFRGGYVFAAGPTWRF